MQKARRHHEKWLRPLVGVRFQELFHSPARGPFHLSFTVLVHYRNIPLTTLLAMARSYYPGEAGTSPVWALPRSLATTGGIISLFSLPQGTKMFQFPWFASTIS